MTTLKLHGHNGLDNIEIKHHLSGLENTILGLFFTRIVACTTTSMISSFQFEFFLKEIRF